MKSKSASDDRFDRMYARAWDIMELRANGYFTPILKHLAMRNHHDAMQTLSNRYSCPKARIFELGSATNLLYRLVKQGVASGAQCLAMDAFNTGNMKGYRLWLSRAARLGDKECEIELRRFELRLPHGDAKKIGRLRPLRVSERVKQAEK